MSHHANVKTCADLPECRPDELRPVVGFTHDQLLSAFLAVRDRGDWKAPIDALVSQDQLAVVLLAIEFFTSTKPRVVRIVPAGSGPSVMWGKAQVTAQGYRAGPAGDH